MDDLELLQAFVSSYLSGCSLLLSNSDLRVEPIGNTLQLLAKTEGLVATAKLSGDQRSTSIRYKSSFWPQLHGAMVKYQCVPVRKSRISGFYEYETIDIPEKYRVRFTDSLDLLQTWWSYQKSDHQPSLMGLLVLHRQIWYPIQDLVCEQGTLTIETSGYQIQMYPLDMLVWLQKLEQPAATPLAPHLETEAYQKQLQQHPELSEQYLSMYRQAMASHSPDDRRIGSYLIEAGLLSPAQVDVVLSDQKLTGMKFGEILVSRGWLKSQTIEFLFENVILPQRTLAKKAVDKARKDVANLQGTNPNHHQGYLAPVAFSNSQQEVIIKTEAHGAQSGQNLSQTPVPQRTSHQPQSLLSGNTPLPVSDQPIAPRCLSIHDRETLATCNKLNLEDLPDWLDMDLPDE